MFALYLMAVFGCSLSSAPKNLSTAGLSNPFLNLANQQKFKTIDFPDIIVKTGFQNDRPIYDHQHRIWWTLWESKVSPATAPIIVWIMGGPGVTPAAIFFSFGGPFTIDEAGVWNKDKLGFNQYANILVASYPYGVGNSGISNNKRKKLKPKNMANNFVRFLQRWWDNHPQYQKNDIYLSGDSAMGQLFPTMYHHAVLSKPEFLPRVKGFLIDGAYFTMRNVEPKFLIYSKMFHLNTKKDEKRYTKKVLELNNMKNSRGALGIYKTVSKYLMKIKRYAPIRRCYYDIRHFTPHNRKSKWGKKADHSCSHLVYLGMRLGQEIYNSNKFEKWIGIQKNTPYAKIINIKVLVKTLLWESKRDNSAGWKAMLNSGLKVAWTSGEYDSCGELTEFYNICRATFGEDIGKQIEDKKWRVKGDGNYKNWKNFHIMKVDNSDHLVYGESPKLAYEFFRGVVEGENLDPQEPVEGMGDGI
jgi:hypothetical protein